MKQTAVVLLIFLYLLFACNAEAQDERIKVKSAKPIAVGIAKAFSPWSPDGKKIMYYAPDPNNDNKPSVFVIELEIE